jgi:hypothetical protein
MLNSSKIITVLKIYIHVYGLSYKQNIEIYKLPLIFNVIYSTQHPAYVSCTFSFTHIFDF